MDDALTRLANKVDDHDRSLTLVSKVVEDINKNLERFADESESLRREMTAHWSAQDKILSKMENVLEKIASYELRFQKVEERQINGCPNFLTNQHNRKEIDDLNSRCAVTMEKLSVANNRIKDLEDDRNKGMWLIVGGFVGILVALIQGFK